MLPHIFDTTAMRDATRVAAICQDRQVTYAELKARSDDVAARLRARGIGRGDFVGLWMSRSIELHVAMLAILKAGAAYVPFDAEAPVERVVACLNDCGAVGVLVDGETSGRASSLAVPTLSFDALLTVGSSHASPGARHAVSDSSAGALDGQADDAAYLIYTSGTSGTPKGVLIRHRNVCHFLRAANTVYRIEAQDVVFQWASAAFDLFVEETWLAYLVGATLFIAPSEVLRETDRLCDVLTRAGVTVLDTVPTLLAMLDGDLPTVRTIIFGGEVLTQRLAQRWCAEGRRVFNSYGPTEVTVVATIAEVRAHEPVTIGRPIPNYTCYVVDDALAPVGPGVVGELLVGGPGVAEGYWGRPELTAQRFIANPFDRDGPDPILYRTGDAVSLDHHGQLIFLGRLDTQEKIRGFRVELGEIEARLSAHPDVAHCAVVKRCDDGVDRLVAFVVPADGVAVDRRALRETLRQGVFEYMIPGQFATLSSLPRLASGKVDRRALTAMALPESPVDGPLEQPASATEALLLDAARKAFGLPHISLDADIFLDLGAHSLLAARFLSLIRQTMSGADLALRDVYETRTLRAMAERLDATRLVQRHDASGEFEPPPLRRRLLCGLAQAAALPFILALAIAPWLGVFIAYDELSGDTFNFVAETIAIICTYGVIHIGTLLLAVVGKWIVLGRTRPGRYPLWGFYYYRCWLVSRLLSLVHVKWLQSTPLLPIYLRVLGADVGRDVVLGELDIATDAMDLVRIGTNVSIGSKTHLANVEVVGNELRIGRIDIGDDAHIGSYCVLGRDVKIGEGALLSDLTALSCCTEVGAWQHWEGSPASQVGRVDRDRLPARATAGLARRVMLLLAYSASLFLLPAISLVPILPGFYLFDTLAERIEGGWGIDSRFLLPVLAWPTAMVFIFLTILLIAALRWIILPRVRAGTSSIFSGFYLRKWIVGFANQLTLETLSSLYATVYMRHWYRLMGARVGRDTEISTSLGARYDLVDIGAKNFIADDVILGDEEITRGWMSLRGVKTGERVFVGNCAAIPPGASLPDDCLIGVKSRPPSTNQALSKGDVWFGSPPIKLPVRERFEHVSQRWTFEPTRRQRFLRAVFEAFRVSLPAMLYISFGTLAVSVLEPAVIARDFHVLIPMYVLCSVAIAVSLTAVAAAIKWLLMGRYRPTVQPMWSWWALRTEAVAVLYYSIAGEMLLEQLRGTPMLPWALGLFGCRFGRGVYMNSTDITEFDCVTVGDFCAVNAAELQTHLYEDRVMKVGHIVLGKGVTIGRGSSVLYDSRVGDFTRLGLLTIVMKGESIPPHGDWLGAPAQPVPSVSPATPGWLVPSDGVCAMALESALELQDDFQHC